MVKMNQTKWRIISASVRGASHIRNNLPNQDAIRLYADSESGLPLILAISDGHGSKKYFRSDRGAKIAVEVAVNTIKEFVQSVDPDLKMQKQITNAKETLQIWGSALKNNPSANEKAAILKELKLASIRLENLIKKKEQPENLSIPKRIAEEQLPKEIVRRWKRSVREDIQQYRNPQGFQNLEGFCNTEVVYGATLLTVLITKSFIIYLQIGDGDILVIEQDGKVQKALSKDERLFANETTSLCTKSAWRDFRFAFQPILDSPPKLILAATDGYSNSFKDDESFLKVASDIYDMIQSEGAEFVENLMEKWLTEATESGSGDDITAGIIFS